MNEGITGYKPRYFRRGSWLDLNFTGYSVPLGIEDVCALLVLHNPYMSEKRRTFNNASPRW